MIKSLLYTLKQACTQIARNKAMTLTSLFSITAMLLILGLFFIIVVNVSLLTENAKQQFDMVKIFLTDETSQENVDGMIEELKGLEAVRDVTFVSEEEAMEIMRSRWGENAYLLEGLSENPLPRSLQITVDDVADAESIAAYAKKFEGVEKVEYSQSVIDKIVRITDAVRIGAIIVILFLVIVSIVVVSNTVKLTVLARGKEISIMKYVGATNWFIRGPFLAEGIIIGIIAASISSALISGLYYWLSKNLSQKILVLFASGLVPMGFMSSNLVVIFVCLGVGIGAVGSIISMRRFLDA